MGDIKGFIKFKRHLPEKRPVQERVNDYREIYTTFSEAEINHQAARCMDCGIPFCHSGCPLGNIIPDFNHAVYQKDWLRAYEILSSTNNFPEFTGRICPAPCEKACVLGINNDPVTIEYIEQRIAEEAFDNGWVKPVVPSKRSGKKVAVIGSGPAGLAAADQLNRAGHEVTVFERNDKAGGLLQYGIPDFKLEKWVVQRRLDIMKESGIQFLTNTNAGIDVTAEELMEAYDAILLCGGSTVPRDLPIPGRQLNGIHFAMQYLEQKNRQVAGQTEFNHEVVSAKDKNVVVIGGGDTGSDCVGTSNRENASTVTQIELLSRPPDERHATTPWPLWPMQLTTSTSHEEGCERKWSILTKEFIGDGTGHIKALKVVNIEWIYDDDLGKSRIREIEGSERLIPCDLALLAVGFLHPQKEGLLNQLGIELDGRGNVKTEDYQTSLEKVFAAGDMRRGQSLVVWAISEGREAAIAIDRFLSGGISVLNSKSYSKLLV